MTYNFAVDGFFVEYRQFGLHGSKPVISDVALSVQPFHDGLDIVSVFKRNGISRWVAGLEHVNAIDEINLF